MQQYLIKKERKPHYIKVFVILLTIFISITYYLFYFQSLPSEYLTPLKVRDSSNEGSIKGIGTIKPYESMLISAPVEATVTRLTVKEGQRVKQGDTLIKLENFDLDQDMQSAKYNISMLESKLTIEKSDLKIAQSKLSSALTRAKNEFSQLELELNANKQLQEKGIVSLIQYQQAELAFQQAKLDIDARQHEVVLFNESYEQRLSALKMNVSIAKEKYEYLVTQKNRLFIKAEQNAIVSKVYGSLGTNFRQGTPLIELIHASKFLVEVQIPQYSANKVLEGQKANIITPNGVLKARVNYVDTVVRNGASTVFLDLLDESPNWLRPEQSIEAEIFFETRHSLKRYVDTPTNFKTYKKWFIYAILPSGDAERIGVANLHEKNKKRIQFPSAMGANYVLLIPSIYNQEKKIKAVL